MSRALRLKNNDYINSDSIAHDRKLLSNILRGDEPMGNIKVDTITTKNLFNINGNINVRQNNGLIDIKNKVINGNILVAGNNGNYDYGSGQQFTNLRGKTFTFSAKCINTGSGSRGVIGIADGYSQVRVENIDLNSTGVITYTATTDNVIVAFSTGNGINAQFTDIQVEIGDVKTDYAPYQPINGTEYIKNFKLYANTAGWYRVAAINDIQTNVMLNIATEFQNSSPSSVLVSILNVYASAKISQLNAVTFSTPSITKVRVQYDNSNRIFYIDCYYQFGSLNNITIKNENILDKEVYIFEPRLVDVEYTTVDELTISY